MRESSIYLQPILRYNRILKSNSQSMDSKKNHKPLIIIGGILIVILLSLFSGYLYLRGTPQFSIYQMGKAVQQRDYNKFEKYVDVNTVVDNVFAEAMKDVDVEDAGIFSGLVLTMAETAKETAKTSFKSSVESGEFGESIWGDINLTNLMLKVKSERHGKISDITLRDDDTVSFSMRKEDGVWRIIDVNNMDKLVDLDEEEKTEESKREVIEKALGEEAVLATIAVKVNKAEKLATLPSSWGDPTKPSSNENTFLKVNVTLRNLSEEDFYMGSDVFYLADSEQNQYEMYDDLFSGDDNNLNYESVKPGLSKTGNVYFEIPKTAKGLYLPFQHKDKPEDYQMKLSL